MRTQDVKLKIVRELKMLRTQDVENSRCQIENSRCQIEKSPTVNPRESENPARTQAPVSRAITILTTQATVCRSHATVRPTPENVCLKHAKCPEADRQPGSDASPAIAGQR